MDLGGQRGPKEGAKGTSEHPRGQWCNSKPNPIDYQIKVTQYTFAMTAGQSEAQRLAGGTPLALKMGSGGSSPPTFLK